MPKKSRVIPLHLKRDIHYNAKTEKENNIIGKRIFELRQEQAMSLANLSDLLENYGVVITRSSISKWESGITFPNCYQMIALCKALKVDSPDYFTSKGIISDLNSTGLKKLAEYKKDLVASGLYQPESNEVSHEIIYIKMPISCLAASAGTGAFLDEGNFEMISFPQHLVPKGAQFGIRVSGDSMQPVYESGQLVWVQQCDSLSPRDVGIFIYDGEGYIKEYAECDPDDPEAFTDCYGICHKQPVLISYNPKYPPRKISPDTPFKIIGRVIK